MGHEAYILIGGEVTLNAAAADLAAVFGTTPTPLLDGRLINLADVAGDRVRGDVEAGFSHLDSLLMLTLSDCSNLGRGEAYLDDVAGRVFDQVAAAVPWHLRLCLLDEGGELVITREREREVLI